jgi:YCII-related domain-containing protein
LAQKLGSAGCKNKLKFCGGGSQDRRDTNCKIAPWQRHGGSLSDEGKIFKAGPFEAHSGRNVRGMFILKTDSLERARSWVATDPAVKAGQLAPEFLKWRVEKGSLQ